MYFFSISPFNMQVALSGATQKHAWQKAQMMQHAGSHWGPDIVEPQPRWILQCGASDLMSGDARPVAPSPFISVPCYQEFRQWVQVMPCKFLQMVPTNEMRWTSLIRQCGVWGCLQSQVLRKQVSRSPFLVIQALSTINQIVTLVAGAELRCSIPDAPPLEVFQTIFNLISYMMSVTVLICL